MTSPGYWTTIGTLNLIMHPTSSFCVSVLVVCPDVERLLLVLELLEVDVLLELLLLPLEDVELLELLEDDDEVELEVELLLERELDELVELEED